MNTLGDRLRCARKAKGITQTQIKEMCGISSGNLSEMENNKVSPTANALFSLKRILGVSIDWLLSGEGEMFALNYDARDLSEEQIEVAESEFANLTTDQAALINAYEKLSNDDKDEIWHSIRYKLSKKSGLGSDSQTSKAGGNGSTKTA